MDDLLSHSGEDQSWKETCSHQILHMTCSVDLDFIDCWLALSDTNMSLTDTNKAHISPLIVIATLSSLVYGYVIMNDHSYSYLIAFNRAKHMFQELQIGL